MPLHWTISHPQRLVIAVAKGDVQAADVVAYLEHVFAQGGGPYRKMFDISHAARPFEDSALRGFADWVRRRADEGPIGPIALVAGGDEGFRQAALFAEAASVDRPIKIFREQHEARRWLNAFAEEQQSLDERREAIRAKRS